MLDDLTVKEVKIKSDSGASYLMKIRPYRTANNVIDGLTITFEDITQQAILNMALQDSEHLYREIFELSSNSIFLVDAVSGKIIEANNISHDLLGYNRLELVNRNFNDVFVIENNTNGIDILRKISANNKESIDISYKSKEGEINKVILQVKTILLSNNPVIICSWETTESYS